MPQEHSQLAWRKTDFSAKPFEHFQSKLNPVRVGEIQIKHVIRSNGLLQNTPNYLTIELSSNTTKAQLQCLNALAPNYTIRQLVRVILIFQY